MQKLTQIQVWEYLREAFHKKNLHKTYTTNDEVYSYFGTCTSYGFCNHVDALFRNKKITLRTWEKISGVIQKDIKGDGYLYPCTLNGAKKRIQFCTNQIRKLKRGY